MKPLLLKLVKSRVTLAAATCLTVFLAGTASAAVTGAFSWSVETGNWPGGIVQVDNAGNVITGIRSGVNKYNPNGTLIWSASVETLVQDMGHIIVDSANNVYVVGKGSANNVTTVGVAKISAGGTVLWSKTFTLNSMPNSGGTAEHEASGPMVLGSNGSLYVLAIGDWNPGIQSTAPVNILRINTSTGAEQNRLPLGPLTADASNPMLNSTIAVDSANNVYYGGPEGIRSYASTLPATPRWTNNQLVVRAAVLDVANNVYVTGYVPNGSGGFDFDVKRLNNANGTQVWDDDNFGEPQSDERLRGGNALAIDSQGQLYAVGGENINGQDIFKINPANGNFIWYAGQGFGLATDMAVALDANDNVYVVGTDSDDNTGNAVINVYDPQGNFLWNQSFSGANMGDVFNSVALDKNGGVYCIGNNNYGLSGNNPTLVKFTESGLIFSGTYKVINRNSAKAMDANGQGTANGTQIDQWTYNAGNNQRWTVTSLGYNQYKIIGVQSGRSLDVAGSGTANGTKVDLWDYNGGNNQKYTFTGTTGGFFRITPGNATGSCIEVNGTSTANGQFVDLRNYTGVNNQQWIFQAP